MEDGDEADVCPQVFGICCEFFEGLGSCLEEDVVDGGLISQGDGSE